MVLRSSPRTAWTLRVTYEYDALGRKVTRTETLFVEKGTGNGNGNARGLLKEHGETAAPALEKGNPKEALSEEDVTGKQDSPGNGLKKDREITRYMYEGLSTALLSE